MNSTSVETVSSTALGESDRAPLTRGMMIAWGVGTLGPLIVLTATNALLLRYLTDFYGLAAGLAASLIAVSKLYDVFADVAMGVVSDRTTSRSGRRRPYLIIGVMLLAVSIVAIFSAPGFQSQTARVWYMTAVLLFYATAYSVFNVPYMAMPGEMTRTYHERTELMSWRVYAVGASILLATFCGPLLLDLFGGGASAYVGMALVFAPIVIIAGIIAFLGTAKAPTTERPHSRLKFGQQIISGLSNGPFVILMLIKFVTLLSLGIQSVFPFFFQRILGAPNSVLGFYFLSQSLMMLATPGLWLWISRRMGKKITFLIALGISVPVWISWQVSGQSDPIALIYLRGVLIGASSSGIILMGQSMLPDTMEYDHLRTGLRREGIFAALYTTVEKLSGAIGVAAVGVILGAYGYVQSRGGAVVQPPSALMAIRFTMTWIPVGTTLAGMAALLAYNLDERSLATAARVAALE